MICLLDGYAVLFGVLICQTIQCNCSLLLA